MHMDNDRFDPPEERDEPEARSRTPERLEGDEDTFHQCLSNLLLVASSFHISETASGRAYQKLTDGLVDSLPFRRSLLYLLDGDHFSLRSVSWDGGDADRLAARLAPWPGEILPESVEWESFEMGRALPVPVEFSDFFAPEVASILGPEQEMVLAPLVDDQGIMGVLVADYADGGEHVSGSGELALLETYAGLAGTLLANLRLYNELKRKYSELRIINAVTRELNQTEAADAMAANILAVLTQSLEAEAGFLLGLDGEAGRARLVTQVGLSPDEEAALQTVPPCRRQDLEAMRHEGQGGKLARYNLRGAGLEGPALMKPLDLAGRPVGLLVLYRKPGGTPFEQDEEATLESVHDHVSLAINSLRLRRIATTDELTALFTRRYLMESLEQELTMGRRLEYAVTLLMLDLDHFKAVNDTHGHQGGDAVLKAVGACLKSGIRGGDICARYGGEELVVVLSHCDANSGKALAEKLRRKIAGLQVPHQDKVLRVTASIGLASQEVGASMASGELISRADQALYQCKANGRNMVLAYKG